MLGRAQRTLGGAVEVDGVGLHSAAPVRLRLGPAAADAGVTFVRADLSPPVEIPARVEAVRTATRATTLGRGAATVGTVEHLLATLSGLGVDNARVEVHGPEIPVLDGACAGFVALVDRAGIVEQAAPRRFFRVRAPVEVRDGARWARLEPHAGFSVRAEIDFDHPAVGRQAFTLEVTPQAFRRDLAFARTFGFAKELEALRAARLALGAGLDNAVLFTAGGVANPGGLRAPDEPARHKAVDAIGDLALLGAPILGRYVGHRAGHALHHRLLSALTG